MRGRVVSLVASRHSFVLHICQWALLLAPDLELSFHTQKLKVLILIPFILDVPRDATFRIGARLSAVRIPLRLAVCR